MEKHIPINVQLIMETILDSIKGYRFEKYNALLRSKDITLAEIL